MGGPLGVLQGLGPPCTLTRVPGAQAKQRPLVSPRARQRTRWKSWTRGGVAPAAGAASRPRWGPGVRKAPGSVVCCDVPLPFKWRSPRLGLLMGADHSGFSLPAPAFFGSGGTNNKSFPSMEPPLSLGTGHPLTPETLLPPLPGPGSLRSETFSGLRGCETLGEGGLRGGICAAASGLPF